MLYSQKKRYIERLEDCKELLECYEKIGKVEPHYDLYIVDDIRDLIKKFPRKDRERLKEKYLYISSMF